MILSDTDIKKAIAAGRIKIDPLPDFATQLGPCAVDFRLGNTFRVFESSKHSVIDPRDKKIQDEITHEVVITDGRPFIVHPGDLVLASTLEHLEISNDLIGRLEGRSSLGRIGIVVHSTAARFDPGWVGNPVLELGNLGRIPVALYPGMRICAFTFEQLSSPASIAYTQKGKYANQSGPTASLLADDK
jgi:dCTP deaminase